jgi:hypothetical protein
MWLAQRRSFYESANVDFLKQLVAGEMVRQEESKITDTRFKISMAKIRKEVKYPLDERKVLEAVEELLFGNIDSKKSEIKLQVIEALFKVGSKIIPGHYIAMANYRFRMLKYWALVEGYLKCFLNSDKDAR